MLGLFQLFIFIYCVCLVIRMIMLQSFNSQVKVYHVSNYEELNNYIHKQSPILLYEKDKQPSSIDLTLKVEYHSEKIPLSKYGETGESLFIYKDTTIPGNTTDYFSSIIFPDTRLLLKPQMSVSIIQGNHTTSIQKNTHNYTFLETIDGNSIIYLINPKYKGMETNYKEIGYEIILQPKTLLYIPLNWYYVQVVNNKVIQKHIEIDDIFTFIPHYLKNYIHNL